jgi:membrane associated rhomboid family serine protease
MLIPFGDDVERTKVPKGVISLIIINLLVAAYEFRLAQDFRTHPEYFEDFIMTFGLVPKDVPSGSVMGMFTYMFLHGGLMHLFGNMLVLWAFGPTLEEFLGTTRFVIMYAVTGVCAGALHFALSLGAEIPLVGASGAIAGVIGVYGIAVGPDTRIKTLLFIFFKSFVIKVPTVAYAMFWMYSQWSGFLSTSSNSNEGGVAFGCHIGGFFGGMLLYPFIKTNTRRLVDHGFGEKRIHDELEEAQAELDAQIAATAAVQLQKCSDCGSELAETHEIAPNLYRCPNKTCGRLNINASALPAPPRNRYAMSH